MRKRKLKLIDKVKPGRILTKDITALEDALGGDRSLVMFFLSYLKHDRNASKAYRYLHPECTERSCSVLGSRMLAKVDFQVILESYGLGIETYLNQLKAGIEAMDKIEVKSTDKEGNVTTEIIENPNHKVRRHYHKALGNLLGLEGADIQINNTNQNLNNNQNSIDNLQDDELDDLIS